LSGAPRDCAENGPDTFRKSLNQAEHIQATTDVMQKQPPEVSDKDVVIEMSSQHGGEEGVAKERVATSSASPRACGRGNARVAEERVAIRKQDPKHSTVQLQEKHSITAAAAQSSHGMGCVLHSFLGVAMFPPPPPGNSTLIWSYALQPEEAASHSGRDSA